MDFEREAGKDRRGRRLHGWEGRRHRDWQKRQPRGKEGCREVKREGRSKRDMWKAEREAGKGRGGGGSRYSCDIWKAEKEVGWEEGRQ